jgi:UDP-N-acetylmuramoyl-L-alanyl-D-glutamate--2,6-diaminopimelate ligase
MQKRLSDLGLQARGGANPVISGLSVDSRDVRAGHLFAAIGGAQVHGASYAGAALDAGAAAILTDAAGAILCAADVTAQGAALIVAQDPREVVSAAAALFFGAQPETMVAVTGTNGKTSVATFTRQLWEALGLRAANIGTTGVEGAFSAPGVHTTPEPVTLHRVLADMAAAGVTHAAMEASSHGLDQRRMDAVHLAAAGFTNFTQDHLDYHGTFEAYFAAKAGLFTRLLPQTGVAVINMDDPKGAEIAALAQARGQEVLGVGADKTARLRLRAQRFDATGQDVRLAGRKSPDPS